MPRLLSIDDDRSVHHLVRIALEGIGVEVSSALTAGEGVEAIETAPPDAVLLDVMLPDMSGLDAFKLIRDRDPKAVTILMSADQQDVLRVRQAGLGPSMTLVKPLSASHVMAALRLGHE